MGDDANPCSRTAPCKTFAGAISKTAAGGIINCLDPAGFGAVTIGKSLTIDCTHTLGAVLASGFNGVNVNALATDIVRLVGLDIEGIGTGLIGVNVIQVGVLHIERCNIWGFRSGGALGVSMNAPTGVASELYITNSVIEDNGSSTTNGGVTIQAAGTGSVKAVIDNTKVANNSAGVRINGAGSTGGLKLSLTRNVIAGNTNNGILSSSAGAQILVIADQNIIVSNATGVQSDGGQSFVNIGRNVIQLNGTGMSPTAGGSLSTYANNEVNSNSPGGDGTTTGAALGFK